MFFATSDKISEIPVNDGVKAVIIRMRNIPSLDISALKVLQELYAHFKEAGVTVIFSHTNKQPLAVMKKAGFTESVGEEYFVDNIDVALLLASEIVK